MHPSIYTSYTPSDLPPHPGGLFTRFVCISDTHSHIYPVPPGDILLHAGDLSSWGSFEQLRFTINWLKSLPHELKIIIAGNHDLCLDLNWRGDLYSGARELLDPEEVDASRKLLQSQEVRDAGIYYLEHQHLEITTSKGVRWKFYGSPAAPLYVEGAFQYIQDVGGKEMWSRIPADVEILLTHTPAFAVLDLTRKGKHAGCKDLTARLEALKQCKLHVFGHIHESQGAKISERKIDGQRRDLVSVNAAMPDGGPAIIVDLYKEPCTIDEVDELS